MAEWCLPWNNNIHNSQLSLLAALMQNEYCVHFRHEKFNMAAAAILDIAGSKI